MDGEQGQQAEQTGEALRAGARAREGKPGSATELASLAALFTNRLRVMVNELRRENCCGKREALATAHHRERRRLRKALSRLRWNLTRLSEAADLVESRIGDKQRARARGDGSAAVMPALSIDTLSAGEEGGDDERE